MVTPPPSKSWCFSSGTEAISGRAGVVKGKKETPGLPRNALRRSASSEVSPRLDALLVERGLVESRSRAQALVLAGAVRVGGEVVTKAGLRVAPDSDVTIEASRGGS